MVDSLYWFQLIYVFIVHTSGYGITSGEKLVYESKSESGIELARVFGVRASGENIEMPLWKAVYYIECNKNKYIRLGDLPTEEQAIEISKFIDGTNHQSYGDNSNEKIINENYEVVSFTYKKRKFNVKDYPTYEGVKPGMEDWSQPAK